MLDLISLTERRLRRQRGFASFAEEPPTRPAPKKLRAYATWLTAFTSQAVESVLRQVKAQSQASFSFRRRSGSASQE